MDYDKTEKSPDLEHWEVKEFNEDGMMILAKFKNADQVSQGMG